MDVCPPSLKPTKGSGPQRSNKSSENAVKISPERDSLITQFGMSVLGNNYINQNETPQEMYARVANWLGSNPEHAQRIYDYASKQWFSPATPILTNAGTRRGLPISCFVGQVNDSLQSISDCWYEHIWLAASGGGTGYYWGTVREIGHNISRVGESSGIIPFVKVQEAITLAISQGSVRRGNSAAYLPVWHPEIKEFICLRRPTGDSPERRAIHLHHGVVIDDEFMLAVQKGSEYSLRSPADNSIVGSVNAREIWSEILSMRLETGEPYLIFVDNVKRGVANHHKQLGLYPVTSNLCSEILLPTGVDDLGNTRTAVCCLASLNLEHRNEWTGNQQFFTDIMEFLDNVLTEFIDTAPPTMHSAVYSAKMERSVGLGVMGWHSFLQSNNVPFESVVAKSWNKIIFNEIAERTKIASQELGRLRGQNPDAFRAGPEYTERFSYKTAIAPTATISIICGGSSPGIDPIIANVFSHKTKHGTFLVKNKYLEKLLESYGKNDAKTWLTIMQSGGSVQGLDFLSETEKLVFKTSFEIDQRWVVDLAADRTPMIDQGQSLNVFFQPKVQKSDLHTIHFMAWKKGVKSMYYCRSAVISTAESSTRVIEKNVRNPYETNTTDTECIACQ